MENLTYASYLADPQIWVAIEREVRRARAEAFHQYLFAPLMYVLGARFRRVASPSAHAGLRTAREAHCG